MLDSLRFVRGAVSSKNFEPSLKHFQIKDKRISAYNGVLSLSSPIECDLDVRPLATKFVHAISLCEESTSLHITETGRLFIKSGTFRAHIDCIAEPFEFIEPVGTTLPVEGGILEAFKSLSDLMGIDASRPWSHGILLAGQSAFVTNNIILVEYWLGHTFPATMGIPAACVKEFLRIGQEPTSIQSDGSTVTFHFEGGRWLMSSLLVIEQWPDPRTLLDKDCIPIPIDDSLFVAIEALKPFTDAQHLYAMWLSPNGTVSTASREDDGARFLLAECRGMMGRYSADQLMRLRGIADRIDWSSYPRPCLFFGDKLRGAIIGLNS